MKITLLSITLLSALITPAFSQTKFGVKGGLNVSNIGGDAQGNDPKLGFHVGAFVNIKSSDKFAIQPELVFSRQGAQSSENSKLKVNYDYINLPVMFHFYASQNVFFMTGPQLGILTAAKIKYEDQSASIKDALNSMDFGLGFGLGVNSDDVTFSARYTLGLSNTSKSDEGTFPNRVFQLSIGFKFQ